MFDKLYELFMKGIYPDTIIDIGAHHGNWTDTMKKMLPNVEYFLFEAIPYNELKRFENDKNVNIFNIALNSTNTEVDWYEMRNTGDSFFKEKTHNFDNCIPIKKQTYMLDTVIEQFNLFKDKKNIFMKIDCQGAEIPILKGAKSLYNKTDFIILELPLFGQYNEGVPTFLEHVQFMDSIGFVPYDIIDNHYINSFNMQIDMLFINKNHEFNNTVNDMLKIK